MGRSLWGVGDLLAVVFVATVLAAACVAEETLTQDEAVFEMREVSVFDKSLFEEFGDCEDDDRSREMSMGEYAEVGAEPSDAVKAYPKLKSQRPAYGTVTFGASWFDPRPSQGLTFHFVLDESVQADAQAAKAKSETGKPTVLRALWNSVTAVLPRAYEPQYDRLYFDANGDLDLTNDPVVKLTKGPPPGASAAAEDDEEETSFDDVRVSGSLTVPLDCGPEFGTQPFRILAMGYDWGDYGICFGYPVARKGRIRIGSQRYVAVLAQSDTVTGRFDSPFTNLYLSPVDGPPQEPARWMGYMHRWSEDLLSTMREVDGRLYSISSTPTGDRLFVKRYRGDLGSFEIDPGQRDVKKSGAAGVFISKNDAILRLGESVAFPVPDARRPRRHRLPVGDYLPVDLTVELGRLIVELSPNEDWDDSDDEETKPPTYGLKIRKDKPCVLDFSEKPIVRFLGPTEDETFHPGDEVDIVAVLVEPTLDMMITDLKDMTHEEDEYTFPDDQGNEVTVPLFASLNPTVVITDSTGEKVGGGKMPFG